MLKIKAVLGYKESSLRTKECLAEKIVELSGAEFSYFQRYLLHDHDFIRDNIDAMWVDESGVSHCLLVLGEGSDDGVLVRSEGTAYARYSALIPHARCIMEAQNMSQSLRELNQKLNTFADFAAKEADRQLTQHGRAELPLGDMGHAFGLDIYDNKTLWNTVTNMTAERLIKWELDFDVAKNMLLLTDYDVLHLIEACEQRIPFDPLVAPSDQQWGIRRVADSEELVQKFEHGNWAARTGFVLDDLAFVEQVGGGNEWLALRRDEQVWQTFESISFGHMIEKNGTEHCREYIFNLQNEQKSEPYQSMEPGLTPMM